MKIEMGPSILANMGQQRRKQIHVHAKSIKLPSFLIHRDRP